MTKNQLRKSIKRAVLRGAERTLAGAKNLFLEIHPERIDEIHSSRPAIFDFLNERGWRISTLGGEVFTKERFTDEIHTFWTVCRKINISQS